MAPIKRRRGKARRKLTNLGKISNYFPKMLMTKEWIPAEAKEGGAVLELRKRKSKEMLEDHTRSTTDAKSRRIDVEETDVNESETRSMGYLGAKSSSWRETTDGQTREATNWVELEKDESGRLPRDLDSKTENE